MPESVSQYPISKFIAGIMDDYGFTRVEFVQALGYRYLDRGLRRLDPWLDQGDGFDRILKQIVAVYGRADELEKALAATKAIKSAEWEAAWLERCKSEEGFVPYIHAQGETTVPNCMYCVYGRRELLRRFRCTSMPGSRRTSTRTTSRDDRTARTGRPGA
jgi:hypothetical protein